ncbi:MAG: 4Fe-4S dicluster domain-containing protein [Lachnospiraceae bacterium]|nr:4Fe-4S dicluster domain-containing protein [Lachnospiraceae bacterium]
MGAINFTGRVLKNLFSKPVTTKYPFEPHVFKERTRGHVENDMDVCVLCGLCQMKCPTGAITVDKKEQTWEIRPFSCIQCRSCVDQCPKKSLSMAQEYQEPGSEKLTKTFPLSDAQKERLAEQARIAAEKAAAAKAAAEAKKKAEAEIKSE